MPDFQTQQNKHIELISLSVREGVRHIACTKVTSEKH